VKSAVVDSHTIAQLEALVREARDAADRFPCAEVPELELTYERLRSRASSLNQIQRWADREEFDTLFPTLAAQTVIEALDDEFGAQRSQSKEPEASVARLLRNLAAWALGLLAAKGLGVEMSGGADERA
jgi:hypothetical protein